VVAAVVEPERTGQPRRLHGRLESGAGSSLRPETALSPAGETAGGARPAGWSLRVEGFDTTDLQEAKALLEELV